MAMAIFPAAAAPSAPGSRGFGSDPLWDDGMAEMSLYDAEEPFYGTPRRFEARMIVVKEDLLKDQRVKSDRGPVAGRTLPVLKLVHVRRIPTGTYEYQQMLTVFLDRDRLAPVKLVMNHFESCGSTFVQAVPQDGSLLHTSHSYWEGEADRILKIPFSDSDLILDALPLQLRGIDFADPAPRSARVLPSQIGGRVRSTTTAPGVVRVAGREKVEVPAGRFDAWRVEVDAGGTKESFHFEAAFPHRLVRMETSGGRTYRLRRSLRLDYWNHHDDGEERLLAGSPAGAGVANLREALAAGSLPAGEGFQARELLRGAEGSGHLVQVSTRIRPHIHRSHEEIAYILEGKGTFRVGGELHAVGAGSLMVVPRGVVHSYEAAEPTVVLAVYHPAFDPADRFFVEEAGP
jgi:quercetin dioxygenase-like cupin family protein